MRRSLLLSGWIRLTTCPPLLRNFAGGNLLVIISMPMYAISSLLRMQSLTLSIGVDLYLIFVRIPSAFKEKWSLLNCISSYLSLISYLWLISLRISARTAFSDLFLTDKCSTSYLLASITQQISHLSLLSHYEPLPIGSSINFLSPSISSSEPSMCFLKA